MSKRSETTASDEDTAMVVTMIKITPPIVVTVGTTMTIRGTKNAGDAVNARVVDINNPSNLIFCAVIQTIDGTTYQVQFTLPSASLYVLVVYSPTESASITLDAR